MSPTGRKIQEHVIKLAKLKAPVRMGILETPTGFEVNAINSWPARMKAFYEKSLSNFKPQVTMIRAWRKDGAHSTNDPSNAELIKAQDMIYCGAGSPSYAIKHLNDSLVWKEMISAHQVGVVLSLGSATAVAVSKYTLPVYEIFKTGQDLFWLPGLDLFSSYGLNLTIIPHWNNQEGEDFDTSRCWMGVKRFEKLRQMLPTETTILGVDEQTALMVNWVNKEVEIMGLGTVTISKKDTEKILTSGRKFPLDTLK
ncbi:MAG: Cysteinyl-tRNA synthetase-like protein [Candidatus Gottesmanbacteria bacterium GW2011_GWB1_43_11]|uniref:Cysteinyl-tRNA synthetase-like protein n=1 Tax=Candidatus Gottesmanbacteria bacterium GW2011_GWB1_43_11 TaxID=1618446 RepID=A0A0G1CM83_9BACT|nr:MAG: Cysteinyl-tRNA synthetase-like protein [Candidatus Gottesmanbacteria bacterium GW2011_GWA2_42_16]KKS82094.1 MAG: Cysteinyl-tRNA synthetase-like protein [Candidatus Gottesmanbacteria bacterium GW2011_GWC1_43_10]KKS86609.1 MAG: Cysteinyl-tRNA synthetase-like protein [Candidatus Gottesmanbacteria bacterium GW2011_GWB1_43_11]OGG09219.1 MAG: hypothetical protein A2699_02410 [Candidatus Gottesmanbacteria bacterium RIFCSPHIGHO2_01_FULL_43_15]OGG26542.1 MAG: hypothetical protein A3A59_02170 [Ca